MLYESCRLDIMYHKLNFTWYQYVSRLSSTDLDGCRIYSTFASCVIHRSCAPTYDRFLAKDTIRSFVGRRTASSHHWTRPKSETSICETAPKYPKSKMEHPPSLLQGTFRGSFLVRTLTEERTTACTVQLGGSHRCSTGSLLGAAYSLSHALRQGWTWGVRWPLAAARPEAVGAR